MSPSRLQVRFLVLRLKSSASRLIPSCRCPRVGPWWAASHDTHQVPSLRGVVGSPPLSGPGVSVCKPRYDIVIWRAENRTHLSKQTRPSTERSRKASYVRDIPSRTDDPLRWVLIVRTQV